MAYLLHELLVSLWSGFNVLRYITFRSALGFFLTFAIVLVALPYFIAWVQRKQFGQPIRNDGPQSHLSKKGTPTMGGLVVTCGVTIGVLVCADLGNLFVWLSLLVLVSFCGLGFLDDYRKVSRGNSKGISARGKFLWQWGSALAICALLLWGRHDGFPTTLAVPFLKEVEFHLGYFFLLFAALIIVSCSNAVNLTDGLDGLMTGPVVSVALAYGIFGYVAGHEEIAKYLQVTYVPGAGELAVVSACVVGGCLGFLWFNSYPAQVFMGDTGSLSLGALLGLLAVITKQELVMVIAGGLFVIEALSVIIQVASFKMTGKRVFRMAPIHHHFELRGLSEPKIIVRFWIVSILLAVIALSTLKLR